VDSELDDDHRQARGSGQRGAVSPPAGNAPAVALPSGMSTETEADEAGDRVDAAVDRIYAGEVAIAAIARGESVDPELLDRAADGLADLLGPGVTGATWTPEDIEGVRRLRALLTGGAPSPEARALAVSYVPFFLGEEEGDERAA
jgi:hypothetical protein